ncbi:minor capsid protein [Eubacteriales bacterium OttesenSCG-928-K08]|nr:minor capsid protein [Eubacteriales bacterium OttesenSCG-928-K08]
MSLTGSVEVRTNRADLLVKVKEFCATGTEIITHEFLDDANFYARVQSGELMNSGIRYTDFKNGIVRWRTPYARRVYYTGFPRKNKNINASILWAERARKENSEKYKRMLQKMVGGTEDA